MSGSAPSRSIVGAAESLLYTMLTRRTFSTLQAAQNEGVFAGLTSGFLGGMYGLRVIQLKLPFASKNGMHSPYSSRPYPKYF